MSALPKATIVSIPPLTPSPSIAKTKPTESSQASSSTSSVDPLRKQALLLEARRARIEWVNASSAPHQQHLLTPIPRKIHGATTTTATTTSDDGQHNGLKLLRASRACEFVKSASDVVSSLYSFGEYGLSADEASDRVITQLSGQVSSSERQKILGVEVVTAVSSPQRQNGSYDLFIKKLCRPEAANVVQSMRAEVSGFEDLVERRNGVMGGESKGLKRVDLLRELSTRMNECLDKTLESLKGNVIWSEEDEEAWDDTKKNVEIFLYSKVYISIWKVCEEIDVDKSLAERFETLHFVSPSHLEISCFETEDGKELDAVLEKPITSLKAINGACSPGTKLACIHEAYRQLSQILQGLTNSPPGADDILPVLIYMLLRAKLRNIYSNLSFIELFSQHENVRGAEWYAFTNLYGAVQFLKDLDMVNAKGLHIDLKTWKEGLGRQQKINIQEERVRNIERKLADVVIPVKAVRDARLEGQVVDLNWGFNYQNEHFQIANPPQQDSDDEEDVIENDEKALKSRW